jgi:CBS domain-containing protein
MRRQVIHLPQEAALEEAIRRTIKFKVNAILITGDGQEARGIVTKTDLMGAYYAGLPLTTPAAAIMVASPLFCHLDDSLDAALETMRAHGIHRLYVWEDAADRAVGVLAYPDIVGYLYSYCRGCDRSLLKAKNRPDPTLGDRFLVREVMTPGVAAVGAEDTLYEVMEALAAQKLGALLIRTATGAPAGVVSKTDLIIAYKHGLAAESPAQAIMSRPVQACAQDDLLVTVLQRMIFLDLYRLFVYRDAPPNVVGVLSLSDAARFRSGTCRACVSSRIQV